ncbi:MAG: hypothetical protein N2049_03870 [Anaerolineales bacterium]|nr:hypothetical protein [Anaerolineales bacterium]
MNLSRGFESRPPRQQRRAHFGRVVHWSAEEMIIFVPPGSAWLGGWLKGL